MNPEVRLAVKKVLKERGLTQDDLAQLTDIDRTNISALLNGRTGKIPGRWQKIFDALNLHLEVCSEGKENQN